MPRLIMATLLVAVVLAGCGASSDSESGSDSTSAAGSGSEAQKPGATSRATPSASYFTEEDTAAINKPAAAVQLAGTAVRDSKRIATCSSIRNYPRWRKCWHRLLDPYSAALNELARVVLSLRSHDVPETCITELRNAAQTFAGFAAKVEAVMAGIDSEKRADQVAAGKAYGATMDDAAAGFVKPFQTITRACYSPEDLASIDASPSATPSATPSP
jgi:hypothetical protein